MCSDPVSWSVLLRLDNSNWVTDLRPKPFCGDRDDDEDADGWWGGKFTSLWVSFLRPWALWLRLCWGLRFGSLLVGVCQTPDAESDCCWGSCFFCKTSLIIRRLRSFVYSSSSCSDLSFDDLCELFLLSLSVAAVGWISMGFLFWLASGVPWVEWLCLWNAKNVEEFHQNSSSSPRSTSRISRFPRPPRISSCQNMPKQPYCSAVINQNKCWLLSRINVNKLKKVLCGLEGHHQMITSLTHLMLKTFLASFTLIMNNGRHYFGLQQADGLLLHQR